MCGRDATRAAACLEHRLPLTRDRYVLLIWISVVRRSNRSLGSRQPATVRRSVCRLLVADCAGSQQSADEISHRTITRRRREDGGASRPRPPSSGALSAVCRLHGALSRRLAARHSDSAARRATMAHVVGTWLVSEGGEGAGQCPRVLRRRGYRGGARVSRDSFRNLGVRASARNFVKFGHFCTKFAQSRRS